MNIVFDKTIPNTFHYTNSLKSDALTILLYFRLKLKFSCMMELSKFPLDEQVCTMEIASCKYLATSVGFYITLSGHKNAIKWLYTFAMSFLAQVI